MPEIIHDIDELRKLQKTMHEVYIDIIAGRESDFTFSSQEAGHQDAANAIHDFYDGWTDGRDKIRESLYNRMQNLKLVIGHYEELQEKLKSAFDQSANSGGAGSGGTSGSTGSEASGDHGPAGAPSPGNLHNLGASEGVLRREIGSEAMQDLYENHPQDIGDYAYGANDEFEYECTSWAMHRWKELGYVGTPGAGNGAEMAANNGGSVHIDPTLGAMASYGSGNGHVMIVEELYVENGVQTMRVSEMNTDGDFAVSSADECYDGRTWTKVGEPNEWQASNHAKGDTRVISFATFP